MNQEWQQFLNTQGAKFADQQLLGFGKTLQEERDACDSLVITALSHYGIMEVAGADATDFLQGQLTNDIKKVDAAHSQLSAYCSPKGRILTDFRIFSRNNLYYFRFDQQLLAATLKRLRMFVLRSKVEITDRSDSLVGIGIAGDAAMDALRQAQLDIPEAVDSATQTNDITVIRIPGNVPRFEIYAPITVSIDLWQQLQASATGIGQATWQLLTIRAGIPEITTETVEAFVPQMVNLQAINGLSFTKGCYPGQEVVARMQYLGKLKRRLFIGSVASDELPRPGEAIMDNSATDGQSCGKVVSAAWESDQQAALLAVIQIDSASKGQLHLSSNDGPTVVLHDLPYSLEKK